MKTLPPLGSTVRIVSAGLRIWPEAEKFIDADCTLCAVFMTGDTQMVAVEHQDDAVCCCFVADMVRTPKQIEQEKRIVEIDALADELAGYEGIDGVRARHHNLALHLVDQGYRKQPSP